jgi:protein arginine N-methyltransferase 1
VEASGHELELGQFIPAHYHFNMLNDERRTGAFEEALGRVVAPGARVLDLGGGTGVLSFFAARAASRVWCVELNPELAGLARELLAENGAAHRVEVVEADAMTYLPPEQVDLVVCEMLHVTLLVEKQIQVVGAFKERYLQAFGPPLPRLMPEAIVQAVQPLQQSFDFHGYHAPTVHFQDGTVEQPRTLELGEPVVYQTIQLAEPLPDRIAWRGALTVARAGTLNAIRFVTKNLLAILESEGRSIDWLMNYLVVPVESPIAVRAGDTVELAFDYEPGGRLSSLRPLVALG